MDDDTQKRMDRLQKQINWVGGAIGVLYGFLIISWLLK